MQNLLMKLIYCHQKITILTVNHFKCFHLAFNLMMHNAQPCDCGKFKPQLLRNFNVRKENELYYNYFYDHKLTFISQIHLK